MKLIFVSVIIIITLSCGLILKSRTRELGQPTTGVYNLVEKDSLSLYMDRDIARIAMAVIDSISEDSIVIANFVNYFVGKDASFYHSIIYRSLQEKDIQEYYCIFDSSSLNKARLDYSQIFKSGFDSAFIYNSPKFGKDYSAYLECFRNVRSLFLRLIDCYDKLGSMILDTDCDDEMRQRLWVMPDIQNPSYWKRAKAKSHDSISVYNKEQLFDEYSFSPLLWDQNKDECPPRCVGLSYYSKGVITIPFFYNGNYICDISFGVE